MKVLVAVAHTSEASRRYEADFRKQIEAALSFGLRTGAVTIKYISASEGELRDNCGPGSAWDVLHLIAPVQISKAARYITIYLESSTGSLRGVSGQFLSDLLSATQIPTIAVYSLDPKSPLDDLAQSVVGRCGVSVVAVNDVSSRNLQTFLAKLHTGLENSDVLAAIPKSMPGILVYPGSASQSASKVSVEMIASKANEQAQHETAWREIVAEKRKLGHFDVFLCHNNEDKPSVREIARQLKEAKILPWLDESELPPGMPWIPLLEEQIDNIRSAAVFFGSAGIGPWQQEELSGFLRQFVKRRLPVVPVLLPDAPAEPELPVFLGARTWVDFRSRESRPLERLIWAITGVRPIDLP